MDPRSSVLVGNRRGPIPRPWLAEHHYMPPPTYPLYQEYRYAPPIMGGHQYPTAATTNPDSLDLLPEQEWTVSWNKLSCCFCLRSGSPPSPEKSMTSPHGASGGNRRHYNDNAPFPGFPILRRNSSSSFLANQNDIYPSSGSVSSFTESDTSSESDSIVKKGDTFDSEELRRPASPPRASTPPPTPVTHKPPVIANRSRSAAVPHPTFHPTNNANLAAPQTPPARPRIDTGDFTGIHSGTTNTSRHRRLRQYDFSQKSMEQIWQGKAVDEQLVLPSYVLLQQPNATSRNDSGYISGLDESEDWGHSFGSNYDGDGDDDVSDEDNGDIYAAVGKLRTSQRLTGDRKKRRKDDRPPKAASGARKKNETRRNNRIDKRPPSGKPPREPEHSMVPSYLPKNSEFDGSTNGNLVVSGWVAVSIGCSMEDKFHRGSKRIDANDIFYLRIVDVLDGAIIILQTTGGAIAHELHLRRDWICESREISSRIGRCVIIRSRSNPMFSIASLLPVSLDGTFFLGDKLISAQQFAQQHDRLFVAGAGKVYAPDEQLDAAMFIMFSLDALIKNCL